jgi:hypothetical protein
MSEIVNFDLAQNIKVELYLPDLVSNVFILGISLLGSDDVLSGNWFILGESLLGGTNVLTDGNPALAYSWQPVEAITSSVTTSIGGSIQDSLYFQPEAGSASITMKSYDYDPSVNKSIRPGTRIRVRATDGVVDEYLFNGYIKTVDVSYGVDGDGWNSIKITALDAHSRIVSTRVADYDTTGYHDGNHVTPLEAIALAVTEAGYTMSPDSVALNHKMPTVHKTDVIINEFINEALITGLGVLWVDPATEQVVVIPRPANTIVAPPGTWIIGNDHGTPYHLCFNDITVKSDGDVVFNSLRVENSNDAAEYVVKVDQDSIDLYGIIAKDVAINTTPDGQLVKWADEVFAQSPTRLVNQIKLPAINDLGTLTQPAFFKPGELVGVKYTKAPLYIDENYTITRVSHSLDAVGWNTTIDLWKEF